MVRMHQIVFSPCGRPAGDRTMFGRVAERLSGRAGMRISRRAVAPSPGPRIPGCREASIRRLCLVFILALALVTSWAAPIGAATTSDITQLHNFAISHDGTKLAFSGTVGGVAGLYEADRNGSNLTLLVAQVAGFYSIDHPDFSPDGTTIAFTAFGNPGG